jgi:hypothetical protein
MTLRIWLYIAAVAAVIGAGAYIYDEIGDHREDKIVVKNLKIERKAQNEKDRIRNHRPDRHGVIGSLRSGTF